MNNLHNSRRHTRFDWSTVDWFATDSQIARMLACSPQAVGQQRDKRRIPNSPLKHTHERTQERLGYMVTNSGKTAKELCAELDIQQSQVYAYRKRFGVQVKDGHFAYPYDQMNCISQIAT